MGQDCDTLEGAVSAPAEEVDGGDCPLELGAIVRSTVLFPTDSPLPSTDLIGRDDDVASIVDDLDASRHRVIIGSDQVGKTSVAAAAATAVSAKGWHVAEMDLARLCGFDELLAGLTESIVAVGGVETDAGNSSNGLGDAIRTLDEVAGRHDRRILLHIDGFQELAITQLFGKVAATGTELRSALEKTEHIVCLFVGRAPTVMRDLFDTKDQPFHKFGRLTQLGPIDDAAWRDALNARFAAGGCELQPAAIDRLLELGGEHARTTMLVAQYTYALGAAQGRRALGEESVEVGFHTALAAERSRADRQFSQIRTLSKHALATALRVAKGESPYKKLPPAVARQTLRGLETAGVVDRPCSGSYQIANPILRHYLSAVAEKRSLGLDSSMVVEHWNAVGRLASAVADVRSGEPDGLARFVETAADTDVTSAKRESAEDGKTAESVEPDESTRPEPAPPEPVPPTVDDDLVAVYDQDVDHGVAPREESTDVVDATPVGALLVEEVDMTTHDEDIDVPPAAPGTAEDAGQHAILRRPRSEEADVIGERVVQTMDAHDPDTDADSSQREHRSAGRGVHSRLGRFIKYSVARRPDHYWQLEVDDHAVGGAVLHQPTSLLGRGTSTGVDPILQAGLLAATFVLILGGLGLLIANEAWNWGAYVGLLFAAFIALCVQLVMLAPKTWARARATWIARRNRGTVVEAVWSEPNQIDSVFQALARKLPGTHVSAYVETPGRVAAFRDLGFCVHRGRVVAGILDPTTERPVRDAAPLVPKQAPAPTQAPTPTQALATTTPVTKPNTATKAPTASLRRHLAGLKRHARWRRSSLSGERGRMATPAHSTGGRRQQEQAIKGVTRQRAAAKKRKRAVAAKNRRANKRNR